MNKSKVIVGVAGSGAMGSGIAQLAAMKGHQVILVDNNHSAIEKSEEYINKALYNLVVKQKINDDDAAKFKNLISFSDNLSDFKSCGIVIEAIVEKLDIKQELFKQLENIVAMDCLLATNTSSLSVTAIAGACVNPSRVIGIHFFNPAPVMPLVEIIPGLTTDEKVIINARSLINGWGKTTVVAKDTPGFIVNRIARPFYGEAIRIYEEQLANYITIDHAMKEVGGFKMGPFELMDFICNDINYAVTETVWQQMFFEPRYKPSLTQKRLVEAGRLGRKSGRGYYTYSGNNPDSNLPDEKKYYQYIVNRILCMLVNEAIDALYHGIATKEDIDLAMTKGVNYPKGLLLWADDMGLSIVLKTINELYDEYSEDRYRPSPLLKKMVANNLKFYNL